MERRESMFDLDIRSRKPIYEQLVDKLKELIIHEVFKADEKLPSVRLLAKELTINPNTIQKAYRELEHQNYIYSIPGKGSFVTAQSELLNNEKVKKMKEDLVKLIAEAMYLGMGKEEILSLISQAEQTVKGEKVMIELTEVKKSFEDIKVLNNVSLTVKKGSIYGLLGSNGAGKTTLLKTIAGIYRQNSGSIHIDNEEVFENVALKQSIIFLPDIPYFLHNPRLSSLRNFTRICTQRGTKNVFSS